MLLITIVMANGSRVERFEETQEGVDKYLLDIQSGANWGRPERWIHEDDLESAGEFKENAIASEEVPGLPEPKMNYKFAAEYSVAVSDVTVEVATKNRIDQMVLLGDAPSAICRKAFLLICGYNQHRELTSVQKDQMAASFQGILYALVLTQRPSVAKALVSQVNVDGLIVTQQMKDDLLEVLKEY